MRAPFPPGKLPLALMQGLLESARSDDPRVIVGPRVGEDAAVLDFGDRYLVAKTDPITFATDEIGHYAVTVNANDIATRGATPRWFLACVLLPEGRTDTALVEAIFAQLIASCDELGVTLVGGHTEVTVGLDRPVIAGVMLGEVEREHLVSTSGLRVGDRLVLTKSVPLEGCAVLARERRTELLAAGLSPRDLDTAARFLHEPGISVVRDARIAAQAGGVTAMHDPTEGGVATALIEMALAAGVGLRVAGDRIPVDPAAAPICAHFGIDPLGTLSSGALLIGVHPDGVDAVLRGLAASGIPATDIGRAVPSIEGMLYEAADGSTGPVLAFEQDEIARIV